MKLNDALIADIETRLTYKPYHSPTIYIGDLLAEMEACGYAPKGTKRKFFANLAKNAAHLSEKQGGIKLMLLLLVLEEQDTQTVAYLQPPPSPTPANPLSARQNAGIRAPKRHA